MCSCMANGVHHTTRQTSCAGYQLIAASNMLYGDTDFMNAVQSCGTVNRVTILTDRIGNPKVS